MPAAPEIRFAAAADVPALVALEQQSFPNPWPEDSLAQEVEGPGTLVLIAAESYTAPPLGYAAYRAGFGCDACFLEVRADNAAAIALYEAEAFHPIGRRPGYYGRGTDAVLYAGSTRSARPPL